MLKDVHKLLEGNKDFIIWFDDVCVNLNVISTANLFIQT